MEKSGERRECLSLLVLSICLILSDCLQIGKGRGRPRWKCRSACNVLTLFLTNITICVATRSQRP